MTLLTFVLQSFLADRKVRNSSPNTLVFYKREINLFIAFMHKKGLLQVEDTTQDLLREFFNQLAEHRNQGGVHATYRSVKSFLLYFEDEYEPEDWRNPIRKVHIKAPPVKPLPGITPENVRHLLNACGSDRDRAIIYCLTNTGCRAHEFLNLNVQDVDLITGEVRIRHGKGDKARVTFLNKEARTLLKRYLRSRKDLAPGSPLWINKWGVRMNIQSLRLVVTTLAQKAEIPHPSLHDFRRCFAISLLRSGVEVLLISMLLGHSSVEVTKRYLDINTDDLRQEHEKLVI